MIYHEERLLQVHPDLANFIDDLCGRLAPRHKDWLIICGWRGQAKQHRAFINGFSKVDWPDSKHNHMTEFKKDGMDIMVPQSLAVDLSPHPYDQGRDEKRLYIVSGYALALADEMGLNIRCGSDWDGDLQTLDQTLKDPWHFELVQI